MVRSPGSEEQRNFLGGCLVEGDSEFERRASSIKRRALVASIILQVLVVAGLVLVPLLSKGESIAAYNPTIMPPYHRGALAPQHPHGPRPIAERHFVCVTCFRSFQPIVASHNPVPAPESTGDIIEGPPGSPEGPNLPGLPDNSVDRRPPPPQVSEEPRTVRVSTKVQEARLIRRVQPVYPPLALTTRREGRVELHAIIATDGSIKSLEVISGDPLLIQSALAAVRDWRYQPTLLNGAPVEVDTSITVIYTLNR